LAKAKKGVKNPWEAATLEWQAASPPPHGNFETYPVVFHGPYEYSVPGEKGDYLPQNVPSVTENNITNNNYEQKSATAPVASR
jgi:cytochrome c oxidase subunit 1